MNFKRTQEIHESSSSGSFTHIEKVSVLGNGDSKISTRTTFKTSSQSSQKVQKSTTIKESSSFPQLKSQLLPQISGTKVGLGKSIFGETYVIGSPSNKEHSLIYSDGKQHSSLRNSQRTFQPNGLPLFNSNDSTRRNIANTPTNSASSLPLSRINPLSPRYGSVPSRLTQSPVVLSNRTTNLGTTVPSSMVNSVPSVPTYSLKSRKRGKALIVNNIRFLSKKNKERTGAAKDHKDLKKLFKDLGFETSDHTDLSSKDMQKKIKEFKKKSFKDYDICCVIMMSHGTNITAKGDVIKGGYTEIYGVDDVGVPIDDILNEFSHEHCEHLNGKPKIFIFQCCRGSVDERGVTSRIATDSAPIKPVTKMHADTLIAYSTLPGFASNRDPKNGSWYIQSICEIFRSHHKDYHIEDMLKIVDDQLSKKHPDYKQTSTYENRGFKQCYLYPRN